MSKAASVLVDQIRSCRAILIWKRAPSPTSPIAGENGWLFYLPFLVNGFLCHGKEGRKRQTLLSVSPLFRGLLGNLIHFRAPKFCPTCGGNWMKGEFSGRYSTCC